MSVLNQKPRLPYIIILIVGLITFFPVFFNGFVWDDEEQILNNALIRSFSNFPLFFQGSTFNPGGASQLTGLYYKPFMIFAFSLFYYFFGYSAFFFHLIQLLIHIVNASLVFMLFKKFGFKIIAALILSLIFLVHPINVESVAYSSGLQDTLFLLFGLWAVLETRRLVFSSFLLLLSVLSKETGFIFAPLLVWVVFLDNKKNTGRILVYLLFCFIIYFFLRFQVAQIYFNKHSLSAIAQISFSERLKSVPKIIFFYLQTFFYPAKLHISQHWFVKNINAMDFWLPAFWDLVILISLLILAVWKKTWIFLFWFILGIAAHLQLMPLDLTVSDRWFYFPLIGLLGVLGQIIPFKKKVVLFLAILIIFGLSARSFIRTMDWKDGLTLYSHDLKYSPESFDLQNNLGVELFRKGDYKTAKTLFLRSTQLAPTWWTNWNNLGAVFEREGDLTRAAIFYKKAIDNGHYYLAYENYTKVLFKQKKFTDLNDFLKKEALPALPYNENLRQIYDFLQR